MHPIRPITRGTRLHGVCGLEYRNTSRVYSIDTALYSRVLQTVFKGTFLLFMS